MARVINYKDKSILKDIRSMLVNIYNGNNVNAHKFRADLQEVYGIPQDVKLKLDPGLEYDDLSMTILVPTGTPVDSHKLDKPQVPFFMNDYWYGDPAVTVTGTRTDEIDDRGVTYSHRFVMQFPNIKTGKVMDTSESKTGSLPTFESFNSGRINMSEEFIDRDSTSDYASYSNNVRAAYDAIKIIDEWVKHPSAATIFIGSCVDSFNRNNRISIQYPNTVDMLRFRFDPYEDGNMGGIFTIMWPAPLSEYGNREIFDENIKQVHSKFDSVAMEMGKKVFAGGQPEVSIAIMI